MSKSLTLSNGLNLARSSGIAQSQIVRPTDSIWFAITAVSFIASRAVWTVIGARSRTATMPPSIVRLEAAHVHFVIGLCAFGESFEFVACAVSGDEIADRAGRITSRSRIPAPLDFGEKPCRVLDRIGQFDPLALAVGVSSGIPIIVGVGLSAFLADGFGLYPFRQRHTGFPFSGQISTLPAWPHRWCPMPSGRRVYGLRLASASGECPKGTCRTMEAGGLPSPTDPKCLSKLEIRPLRFPGRHRPASDRPEASYPSCAVSFGLTGGRYLVTDVQPGETHAVEFSPIEKMSDVLIIRSIMPRRGPKWNGGYRLIVRLGATANEKERSRPRFPIVEVLGVRAMHAARSDDEGTSSILGR
jgi:hypothetical protein